MTPETIQDKTHDKVYGKARAFFMPVIQATTLAVMVKAGTTLAAFAGTAVAQEGDKAPPTAYALSTARAQAQGWCNDPSPVQRGLTAGEQADLRSLGVAEETVAHLKIFQCDTPGKVNDVPGGVDALAVAVYDEMWFLGAKNHADDYAQAPAVIRKTFIHEAMHFRQYQDAAATGVAAADCDIYDYEVFEGADLHVDYCMEQSATLVEDYHALFLHAAPVQASSRIFYRSEETILRQHMRLRDIVEEDMPVLAEMRKARDAGLAVSFEAAVGEGRLRPLTAGEKADLSQIFPLQEDVDALYIQFVENAQDALVQPPSGRLVIAVPADMRADDFGKSSAGAAAQAGFMARAGAALSPHAPDQPCLTDIESGKRFDMFCAPQRGALVREYDGRFLSGERVEDIPASRLPDADLQRMIEHHHPQAQSARMEAEREKPQVSTLPSGAPSGPKRVL